MSDDVREDFAEAVNMTPKQLEEWLATDESRSVGRSDGGEPVGHEMGRHIVELLRAKKGELGEEDEKRMRKVVGYVHRHLAQRPSGDVRDTRWRYSLMNWGHDPLKGLGEPAQRAHRPLRAQSAAQNSANAAILGRRDSFGSCRPNTTASAASENTRAATAARSAGPRGASTIAPPMAMSRTAMPPTSVRTPGDTAPSGPTRPHGRASTSGRRAMTML